MVPVYLSMVTACCYGGFSHDVITTKIYQGKTKNSCCVGLQSDGSLHGSVNAKRYNASSMCWIGQKYHHKRAKLNLSVRPVRFWLIPHILPCIKLYSKMVAQVLVYECVRFWWSRLASIRETLLSWQAAPIVDNGLVSNINYPSTSVAVEHDRARAP